MTMTPRLRQIFSTAALLTACLMLPACDGFGGEDDEEPVDITVLFAYTSAVDDSTENIESVVGRALHETNVAYANSDVDLRLRGVHLMEIAYAETERLQDLERLMRPDDGFLDAIHAARDEHEADIVVLITSDRTLTMNGAIMADETTAFVLVYWETLGAPDYALAHEIGHLQGARHSPESDPMTEPFSYGHGFRNDSVKTIMSTGRLEVLPYFSSPNLSFEGVVLGDSTSRDVARVLRESAVYVSNFRGPTTPTDFVPPSTWPTIDLDD